MRERRGTRQAKALVGCALLLALCALLTPSPAPVRAAGVVGGGFPESCTTSALLAALNGGGLVTFNCGPAPVSISLTSRIHISGTVTLDGAGLVTLNGGGATGLFLVTTGATLELRNLTLSQGSDPGGHGGAIYNAGSLRLRGVTVRDNQADAGGGIYNAGGNVEVSESTLHGNGAGLSGGGGIYNAGGTLTIERSTLSGNTSRMHGGGVFSQAGHLRISNSTLSGNSAAQRGGGIYHVGPAELLWSTLSGNRARFGDGGNVYSIGSLTWGAVIFAAGTPRNCSGIGTFVSRGGTISSDSSCSAGGPGDRNNLDPRLGPLRDNGGPSQTHALLGGSPARDAATQGGCPTTDQRGVPRPIDGNGDGTAQCDAGAVEAAPNAGPSMSGAPYLDESSSAINRGTFGLRWPVASDPEGDPVTYTLLHKEARDASYSIVAEGLTSTSYVFGADNPEAVGVWTYIVRASDGAASGAPSPASLPVTVTDEARGI
ncbi:MAG: hypothetical protein DCC58_10810, partial [Chloroflexi bacterium]